MRLEIVEFSSVDHESEKALHQQFKRYRIRGEWFRYEGKLKTYVGNLMKKKPTTT